MRIIQIAMCAATLALAAGADASAQQSTVATGDPTAILQSFTEANIAAVAREVGFEAQVANYSDGSSDVKIVGENAVFYAKPVACQNSICYGLVIFAFFKPAGGATLDQVNAFNAKKAFSKAVALDQTAVLTRYEIADFGIPDGNLASNFTNFVAVANEFDTFLSRANSVSKKIEEEPTHPSKAIQTSFAMAPDDLTGHWKAMINAGDANLFHP